MTADSQSPWKDYANDVFKRNVTSSIRFCVINGWTANSVNGTIAYWARFKLNASIGTIPVLQRIKLATNSSQISGDGFQEFHGNAEPERPLLFHQRLSDDLFGSSPGNSNIDFSANITSSLFDNKFSSGADDGVSLIIHIPTGIQTAKPITFRAIFIAKGAGSGDVKFDLTYATMKIGSILDGSIADQTETQLISIDNELDVAKEVSFTFSLAGSTSDDFVIISFSRNASHGTDTFPSATDIVFIEGTAFFWR